MISERMEGFGSVRSYIRDLFEYGRMRAGIVGESEVCDFSLGNPSVPAPAIVNESIVDIVSTMPSKAVHGYTSGPGDQGTRAAIADDLNFRFGTDYTAANIYMVNGAATSVTASFKALTINSDTEFIAIAPYFPEYDVFGEISGAKVKYISADIPDFQIRFDELAEAINANTQGIIINSPNNPSGGVYTEETIIKLAELLTKKSEELGHPVYIISDEPYRELVYDNKEVPFVPKYYKDTLVCYSYSKSLSLPGERIGYVLVPNGMTDGTENVFFAVSGAGRALGAVCAPSLMQYVVRRCAEAHTMPDMKPYEENRKLLCDSLKAMGYDFCSPDGTFYLFLKAPNGNSMEFSEKAKQKDVLIVPGDIFKCPGYMRVSYCVDKAVIEKSLPRFEELIKNYMGTELV